MSRAADLRFLRRALALARRGSGLTLPNPRVGAVLVQNGNVIGEGFHLRAGTPHAEVHAITDAKKHGHARAGATLYITLEPCSTQGRTPPCTDLIIREKIARVVFAATDPNPAHAGRAAEILRAAGVEVSAGLLADETTALNRDFNWVMVNHRPWVVGKIALSLDGRITTPDGDDRWLTSTASRRAAHELRWEADAILVGAETARIDNPRLTIRLPERAGYPRRSEKRQPWRIVLTRTRHLDRELHLFSDTHRDSTIVFHDQPFPEIMAALGTMGVSHLLIEGGGRVLTEALRAGVVNEIAFFLAPSLMGTVPRALHRFDAPVLLRDPNYTRVGPDLLCRALVEVRDPPTSSG